MAKRIRNSAGLGSMLPNGLPDILSAVPEARLSITHRDLECRIDNALHDYCMSVELAPARRRERQAHRKRLLDAVRNLERLADAPATRTLVDELTCFALYRFETGEPLAGGEAIALPLEELLASLRSFERALTRPVDAAGDAGDSASTLPPLHELVGELDAIFRNAFEWGHLPRRPAGAFTRFARAVLHQADIFPTKDGKRGEFAVSAIDDALKKYREHERRIARSGLKRAAAP